MTSIVAGTAGTLLVQWREHEGGPPADVTSQTITITPPSGGAPVVGPTGTGIVHAATGVYTYSWTPAADATLGDYTVVWEAVDADLEDVSAAEVVTVTAAASTDVGLVRLLIPDTDTDPDVRLFTDDELQAFLTLELSVRRAAAQALEVAASSEVLVSKVIRTRDGLQTDGAKVSDALLKRAAQLRKQADDAGDPGGLDTYFDIVDIPPTIYAELAEFEDT